MQKVHQKAQKMLSNQKNGVKYEYFTKYFFEMDQKMQKKLQSFHFCVVFLHLLINFMTKYAFLYQLLSFFCHKFVYYFTIIAVF